MPASGYTAITFVADELLTSTKMNLMGANDAAFNNGNGFNDSAIIARHIATNAVDMTKIDKSTNHRCLRYLNTASAMASNWQDFPVDSTLENVGLSFPSPSYVQVARDGNYLVGAISRVAAGGSGVVGTRINIYRAGSLIDTWGAGVFNADSVSNTSGVLPLLANDVIRFYVYNGAGWTPSGMNNLGAGQDRAFVNKLWVIEQRA